MSLDAFDTIANPVERPFISIEILFHIIAVTIA